MDGPLVSVVTPVYNGEAHLAECVESVLNQTYDNWLYILVDNCSTDGTRELAMSFAKRDDRVEYRRFDEFVDVVSSHNRAFDAQNARSVYCKILGADDWIYPECLSKMVALGEAQPNVGAVGSYRLTGSEVDLTGLPYARSYVPGREIVAASLLGRLSVTGSPTALLLRSDTLRRRAPFYDPTYRHADTEAVYWTLMQSDFGFVHQVLTYSRPAEGGETPISNRIKSHTAERLRMLVRYGPEVLSEDEYRAELQRQLRSYVWWQTKQRLKPTRRRDSLFKSSHLTLMELLASEAGDDPDVERASRFVRRLLQ